MNRSLTTRAAGRTILASLAEGDTVQELLNDFPTLKEADVRAVVAFAAASAQENLPLQSVPDVPWKALDVTSSCRSN